ncbi:MAG: carboxypeptidase regulatory-like domain-containing protein, partial [Verrucomicrobia bacterium]|nr:carboxypeptidase regulatory-like domain-containing protein [Cytophagales bacterium]
PWLRVGVNFIAARTINNYVYLDRNLVDQPFFTLDNEGGRGVFVPANTITASGLTDNTRGRKSPGVGRTLLFTNGAVLNTFTSVLDAEVRIPAINGGEPGLFNISYTWNEAKDNTSYNGNVANTSTFRPVKSDPRSLDEINFSDNQFRTKVAAYLVSPSFYGFVVSGSYTGIGGTRYSLTVDGDINGDFVGGPGTDNDLAFVFDPNNPETPQNIRESMQKVLDNPDNRAVEHIRNSIGTIADRNGGENPFFGTFNLRLTKIFKIYKSQKLELMGEVFNLANLLKRDWGGNYNLGNQTLLVPTGFNQVTRRYSYRVNENVGVTQRNGTPYQIQLGVRYSF